MSSQSSPPFRLPEQPEPIPNQYIVVFKDGTTSTTRQKHRAWAAERHFDVLSTQGHNIGTRGLLHKFNVCDGAVTGYCAQMTAELAEEINNTDEVDFVEQDYKVYALELVEQKDSPNWGLARLSHDDKLTDETKTVYTYDDDAAGAGTYSYIIDTGILADHVDFEGRATFGFNTVSGSSNTDKNGHGTHVAGTIGSKTYGVAKKTNLIGVKVLGDDGSGSNSTVIAGIEWALRDARAKGIKKCVANMSLGGGVSAALNRSVKAAVAAGLTICVAAGNEARDANTSSPASEPTAITVGSFGITDVMATTSNWGTKVDILAPGVNILSTWIDEEQGKALDRTKTISGTSMATPHVAGLIAYFISKDATLNTPAKLVAHLKKLGIKNKIDAASVRKGTVNAIASNGELNGKAGKK